VDTSGRSAYLQFRMISTNRTPRVGTREYTHARPLDATQKGALDERMNSLNRPANSAMVAHQSRRVE